MDKHIFNQFSNDSKDFIRHPVTAFDPFYTRDYDNFRYRWNCFLTECKRLLIDYLKLAIDDSSESDLRNASKVLGIASDTLSKIRGYESNSGIVLLHRSRSQRPGVRMHLSLLNLFRLIDD